MHFKKLVLIGFKSFPQKTVFEFEPGVTAIVGPNGCGKSNIADAIRWVLGEQRAKDLRGDLMEDVIFSGTVEAKPFGMAEVNLTLVDDNDMLGLGLCEVMISRKLFRSGESQYLINKKQCRLRDIQELLAGTGIGIDAYSHFEQGKIDAILSSKPEDRRELFDEAAGIMKYKRDKRITIRKIEATEDNLTRLNDIIREVKRQINSINRQAGKARSYKKLLEELAKIEVGLLLRNRDKNAVEYNDLEEKHKDTKKSIDDTNALIELKEDEIGDKRGKLQDLEAEYERLQGRKLEILRSIDRENNNISLCEGRIKDTKNLNETGRRRIDEMVASISTVEKDLAMRREELEKIKAEKEECSPELAAKEEEIRSFSSLFDSDNEALQRNYDRSLEIMRDEVKIENELEGLCESKEENIKLLEKARREYEDLQSRQAEVDKGEKSLVESKISLETRLEQVSAKVTDFNCRIEERNKKQSDNRRQMQALEQNLAKATSQYNLLRSMQESYEGYYTGVKAVLKESKSENSSLAGVHGVVGDVITVEKGYETAIETSLGNRVQNIITESGEAAECAIAFLKRSGSGRATFLALDILRDTQVPTDELNELSGTEPGVLGSALDFLQYEPVYTPVVRFLLSRTAIVRDLDSALNIARKKRYNLSLVTLDGEMISQRGAISGGSALENRRGLLMREAHISELANEKQRLSEEVDRFSGLEETIEAVLVELEHEQAEIVRSLKPLRDKLSDKEREFVRISALSDSLDKEARSIAARIEELQGELDVSERSKEPVEEKSLKLREERSAVDAEIERIRYKMSGVEERRGTLQEELTELKVSNASLGEREGFLKKSCTRLDEELRERKESIERRSDEIDSSRLRIEELNKNIAFIREALENLEQEKVSLEKAIELIDEQREETVSSIIALEEELKRSRLSVKSVQEEESSQSIRLAELRFSINGTDERLRNEYNLTPNTPLAKRLPEDTNWDEIETRIEELRRKKESMGDVNMYAIEEEERLHERYEVLTEQQADLINAKESLLKVISKINTEARKLFRETFDRVRESFRERFVQLFGGGRADLILLDENDILECGIDIIASPPGKKLQNISLLSGGEKVMTAVSLLFAVFKVKPSPFCILDEVDAALDDSNIGRFAETLTGFLEKSQFIIITHNKRTIAMADVLYGITMEKSGVSKVVSVRFREKHDPRQRIMQQIIEGDDENYEEMAVDETPENENSDNVSEKD